MIAHPSTQRIFAAYLLGTGSKAVLDDMNFGFRGKCSPAQISEQPFQQIGAKVGRNDDGGFHAAITGATKAEAAVDPLLLNRVQSDVALP